ncbi:MAG: imidazole glycerol phosphate synthase subunit HisH [Crocinitomicaceae bacterium]|nr:imidazole glycerol phosphate synthase subunit HisH [Crocinitomicaceae bacterium]
MKIAIIDYGAGNVKSVQNALNRLGVESFLTDNPEEIKTAEKVVFPGVGHAKAAMEILEQKQLVEVIQNLTQPVLGICLGMQLLFDKSEEGNTKCIGVINGEVKPFTSKELKTTQIGWNKLFTNENELLAGVSDDYVYYVNSYYVPYNKAYTIGWTNYGIKFSGSVKKDNYYGCQFHPEKSGSIGERILKNFVEL